ncbi:hypothetical protein C1645_833694 [Glomus cerebriforme]|uniref:DUF7431 domain-containing protein n=1 Tax=Glomus cerebriforme TaxID=658196 RepID=A0A397SB55_9GLOM|nr:hypothetical protein C1645_833694 [Glomus cerebriforme]
MNNTLSFATNHNKKTNKTLYLKTESGPDWKFLKDKLKLEYGRNVTLENANKRAFTIMDCEMNEIIDRYEHRTIQIDSEDDKIMKNYLYLIADIDVPNFAGVLGILIRKPTTEIIEAVKCIIKSKDPRKFKEITNEFDSSKENASEDVTNTSGQFCSNNFDETEWIKSLNDFKNWSCIKFKDKISIFQLLSKDLCEQILSLVEKQILYTNIEDCIYHLFEHEKFKTSKSLDLEYDTSILYIGIPVLNKFDSSNNSLVIGYHFFNDKENRRIRTDFSAPMACLLEKQTFWH